MTSITRWNNDQNSNSSQTDDVLLAIDVGHEHIEDKEQNSNDKIHALSDDE